MTTDDFLNTPIKKIEKLCIESPNLRQIMVEKGYSQMISDKVFQDMNKYLSPEKVYEDKENRYIDIDDYSPRNSPQMNDFNKFFNDLHRVEFKSMESINTHYSITKLQENPKEKVYSTKKRRTLTGIEESPVFQETESLPVLLGKLDPQGQQQTSPILSYNQVSPNKKSSQKVSPNKISLNKVSPNKILPNKISPSKKSYNLNELLTSPTKINSSDIPKLNKDFKLPSLNVSSIPQLNKPSINLQHKSSIPTLTHKSSIPSFNHPDGLAHKSSIPKLSKTVPHKSSIPSFTRILLPKPEPVNRPLPVKPVINGFKIPDKSISTISTTLGPPRTGVKSKFSLTNGNLEYKRELESSLKRKSSNQSLHSYERPTVSSSQKSFDKIMRFRKRFNA